MTIARCRHIAAHAGQVIPDFLWTHYIGLWAWALWGSVGSLTITPSRAMGIERQNLVGFDRLTHVGRWLVGIAKTVGFDNEMRLG